MTQSQDLAQSGVRAARLRYGIVGLGFIAQLHLDAIARLSNHFGTTLEVVSGADSNSDAIARFPFKLPRTSLDYRDVTRANDVDVVIVAVPNDHHRAVVADALRHGKLVITEKPLAATIEDARSILHDAEESVRDHAVAFVFRTWPTVELAKQIIEAGEIGEIFGYRGHMVHGHSLDPNYPTSWRMDPERSGGGAIVDIGSHAIDIARYLVGDVASVSALSQTVVPDRPTMSDPVKRVPVLVDDYTSLQVKFQSGATGQIVATWAASGESTDVAFDILGTKGSLRFSWRRPEELVVAKLGENPHTRTLGHEDPDAELRFGVPGLGLGYVDAFVGLHSRIISRLQGGEEIRYPTVSDAWQCALIVEAAQRSAADGGAWCSVESVLNGSVDPDLG